MVFLPLERKSMYIFASQIVSASPTPKSAQRLLRKAQVTAVTIILAALLAWINPALLDHKSAANSDVRAPLETNAAVFHKRKVISFPKPEVPVKIMIPKIYVAATVEIVGKDQNGAMDVPKHTANVGWYQFGPKPGEVGSAVIDGHYDTVTGAPAVFYNLSDLTIGDVIKVQDATGTVYIFSVRDIQRYDYNSLPLQKIFATNTVPSLNLITCSGTFDPEKNMYLRRTVIYSEFLRVE